MGATLTDAKTYEAHRIDCTVPRGGLDFIYGDAFPHETDMDQLSGVDFDKGCYVGQEVIIRVLHRGHGRVARKLVGLTLDGEDVLTMSVDQRARAGLSCLPQESSVFRRLTVEENLKTGFAPLKRENRSIPDDVFSLFPVLNGMRHIDLLSERLGSAAVLGGLDRLFSATEEEEQVTTVAYLVIDPETGRTRSDVVHPEVLSLNDVIAGRIPISFEGIAGQRAAIEGVRTLKLSRFTDDRGFFLEIFRARANHPAGSKLAEFLEKQTSDTDVFVIGGGNSAGQAALHLARYANRVVILVRGDCDGAQRHLDKLKECDLVIESVIEDLGEKIRK